MHLVILFWVGHRPVNSKKDNRIKERKERMKRKTQKKDTKERHKRKTEKKDRKERQKRKTEKKDKLENKKMEEGRGTSVTHLRTYVCAHVEGLPHEHTHR